MPVVIAAAAPAAGLLEHRIGPAPLMLAGAAALALACAALTPSGRAAR